MIKISEPKYYNLVYIPKTIDTITPYYTVEFTSKLLNKTFTFEKVVDYGGYVDYYVFPLKISVLRDGEYEYAVYSKNKSILLTNGMIQIGDYTIDKTNYKEEIKYKSYNG